MSEKKVVLESIKVMQRILVKLVSGDQISENEIKNLSRISKKINQLINEETASDKNTSIELEVTKYLDSLSIPKNVKGYYYLRYAILLKYEKSGEMQTLTKQLYSAVAKEFNATSSQVERNIRNAIEVGWNKGSRKKQHEIFGCMVSSRKGNPTNSEFISTIVDKLKLEHK